MRFSLVKDDSAFGTEPFPGLLMKPCQEATLPKNILDLLTEFYNCLYNDHFTSDRKSTRLNSSHSQISYAVFCLKKKNPPTFDRFASLQCHNGFGFLALDLSSSDILTIRSAYLTALTRIQPRLHH